MKGKALGEALGSLPEEMVAEAMEPARTRRSFFWLRLAACIAVIISLFFGLWAAQPEIKTDEETLKTESNDHTISFGEINGNGTIYASYDKGYTSVEDLLEDAALIVRATPIAVESESDIAICWVLQVEESNEEGLETIRLRQLKDEYVLKLGQEAVLALQPDADDGYYNIPGGGCGLFRMDEATESMSGLLLESLKEHTPAVYTSDGLTLHEVFDILTELRGK